MGDTKKDVDLSGLAWFKKNQAKYPNSAKIEDLDGSFKKNVQAFAKALEAAGATVSPTSTKRNPKRAAIMHWAFKVAKGKVKPEKVPKIEGVKIEWDHGDAKASVAAAKEMVGKKGFNIAFQPSLTSLHITGKAIDMDISWKGTLKIKDNADKEVVIDKAPSNGNNKALHPVGASYGVKKLASDPPHWSINGK